MSLDVSRLRRRPPGPRLLIALDQSTLSELAYNPKHAATRKLLTDGATCGALVCPTSPGAADETLEAQSSWRAIYDLLDELSIGIEFHDPKTIRQMEAFAAVAGFCQEPPLYSVTDEAFDTDPQTPLDELFPGGFRVTARLGPTDLQSEEVTHEKDKEARVQAAYDRVRELRLTFEEQAEGEYEHMVRWVLGPIADPNFEMEFASKKAAATWSPWEVGPGALSEYVAISQRKAFADSLVENYPALLGRERQFAESDELANMPSLRYPALLRAGLGTMPARRAKRGDGYDIDHLTCGLSRCDIVTADGSMTQLVRNHKLVPDGCQLFSTREMRAFHAAVERALPELH